ncbi:MAG TPA: UTRA domain-containing protein, partial [Acidimicrobiales bacterium]|nr:UTRA domain-containing protein [Acidimicrobiales bacterium]
RREVEATLSGVREARLLGIDKGAPLLRLRNIGYTTGERALDYFIALHRGDRTMFEVVLSNPVGGASRFAQVNVVAGCPVS